MDNLLPASHQSPAGIRKAIALRAKERRLQLGWSRATLAVRAGVSQWTLKHFEHTGKIALETMIQIAVALNDADSLNSLFSKRGTAPASMAELEKLHPVQRVRGRTVA
jgi:transcriptional regulator with XRE-family HTH domain